MKADQNIYLKFKYLRALVWGRQRKRSDNTLQKTPNGFCIHSFSIKIQQFLNHLCCFWQALMLAALLCQPHAGEQPPSLLCEGPCFLQALAQHSWHLLFVQLSPSRWLSGLHLSTLVELLRQLSHRSAALFLVLVKNGVLCGLETFITILHCGLLNLSFW